MNSKTVVLHIDDNERELKQVSRHLRSLSSRMRLLSASSLEESETAIDAARKESTEISVALVILDLVLHRDENQAAEEDPDIPPATDGITQLGGLHAYKTLVKDRRIPKGTPILVRSMLDRLDIVPDSLIAATFAKTKVTSVPKISTRGNLYSIISDIDATLLFAVVGLLWPTQIPTAYIKDTGFGQVEVPYSGSQQELRKIATQLQDNFDKGARTFCVTGKSGVGKELIARAIYNLVFGGLETEGDNSPAWIDVNVPTLCSENGIYRLLGVVENYFGDNQPAKPGFLVGSRGGAIVFDEADSMDAKIQDVMLRVLEERKFKVVGETDDTTLHPDMLLIFIMGQAKKPIGKQLEDGDFREDLWARISKGLITLQPLKGNMETIREITRSTVPLIAKPLMEKYGRKGEFTISECVWPMLAEYDWPFNKRELVDTIDGAIARSIREFREVQLRGEHIRFEETEVHDEFRDMLNLENGLRQFEIDEARKMYDALVICNGVQRCARRRLMEAGEPWKESDSPKWERRKKRYFNKDKFDAFIARLKN